jgi:hypothetical protein
MVVKANIVLDVAPVLPQLCKKCGGTGGYQIEPENASGPWTIYSCNHLSHEKYNTWVKNNKETEELVALGFLDDVSAEYSESIERVAKSTGRLVRIFKITDIGIAMFDSSHPVSTLAS